VENKLPVRDIQHGDVGSQLAMRLLGSIGRLDQHKLRTGRLSDDDWNGSPTPWASFTTRRTRRRVRGAERLELRARARRLHRQYGALG